jgi:hypothetical protein
LLKTFVRTLKIFVRKLRPKLINEIDPRAWEDWAIYSQEFLIQLQNIFLGLATTDRDAGKAAQLHFIFLVHFLVCCSKLNLATLVGMCVESKCWQFFPLLHSRQGDQIGRWATVYYGKLFKNYKSSPQFWLLFPLVEFFGSATP